MPRTVLPLLRSALLALSSVLLAGCVGTAEPPRAATLDKGTVLRIADRLRDQGDSAMAEEFYRRAISDNPDNAAAYHGLATLQVAQGDLAAAARSYRAALPHDTQNGTLHRDFAKLLLAQGQYEEATTHYRAALALDETDAKALNGLGVALDQRGDHRAAQQSYQQALALNADDMVAINNLSMSYIIAGDYVAAITLLEPLADSFKATTAIRQNLALAYQQVGQNKATASAGGASSVSAALPEPTLQPPSTAPQAVPEPAAPAVSPPPPAAPALAVMLDKGLPMPSPALALLAPTPVRTEPSASATSPEVPEPQMPLMAAAEQHPVAMSGASPIHTTSAVPAAAAVSLPTLVPQPAAAPTEQRTVFGPFATDRIAQAQQARLRQQLADELPKRALVNIVTRLNANGTPEFVLHLYGFADQAAIDEFCRRALKKGFPCQQG